MNKRLIICALSLTWITLLLGQDLNKLKDKALISYQIREYENCLDCCEQFIETSAKNDPEIDKILQASIDTLSIRKIDEAKDLAQIFNFPKALNILTNIDKRYSDYQSLIPMINQYNHYVKEQKDGKMVSVQLAQTLKKYDIVDSFHDGWALVSKQTQEGYAHNHISSFGKEIGTFNSYAVYSRKFSDGLSVYGAESITSILDVNGLSIFAWDIGIDKPWDFDAFSDFEEGYLRIRNKKNGKWGYVGKSGTKIPCKYDEAWPFHCGLALVFKDGHCYFIDTSGKKHGKNIKLFGPRHWPIAYYSENVVWVREEYENREFHVAIDKFGNCIIKIPYEFECGDKRGIIELIHPFHCGLSKIELNTLKDNRSNYGFIDKKGQVVIDFIYEDAGDFSDNLCAVKYGNQWGYIDTLGSIVIPFQYDNADSFKDGLARVEDNGKWGFINYSGDIVIPTIYDFALPFSEGFAVVKKNGEYGLIDKYGFCTLNYHL